MTKRIIGTCALWLLTAAELNVLAQTSPSQPVPPLMIRSLTGQDLFEFYCATCHGRDGRGNGPVVAALKVPPPDLTRLSTANGGTFPRQRVLRFVAQGGNVLTPAHGTADMPVWGPVFRGLDPSSTLADIRIANVVDHVESLQAK